MPSAIAAHALAAAPPGEAGAEIMPSNVMSSPTLAPSAGDKGSTLFGRGVHAALWGYGRVEYGVILVVIRG